MEQGELAERCVYQRRPKPPIDQARELRLEQRFAVELEAVVP
jgi:hypothetical protein